MAQLCYEDVIVGADIPGFERRLTLRDNVMYCAAYRDFNELHYDPEVAVARGFSGPVVPGLLESALLTKMLTDWVTPAGWVRRLKATYRRPLIAGEAIVCKGKVRAKNVEGDEHRIECEVWAENSEGVVIAPATATVVLPVRVG